MAAIVTIVIVVQTQKTIKISSKSEGLKVFNEFAEKYDKLSILDVSDSKRIKKITGKKVGYKIRNILQNKDRIYIAGSRNISSFDITQPGKLMWAIEYELIAGIENIFVGDDGNIYVAAGSDGLRVLIIDGKNKKTIQD